MRIITSVSARKVVTTAACFGAFMVIAFMAPGSADAQCAMCRDAVAAAPTATREAMNYAIVGLALAPYGIGAVATWFASPSLRAYLKALLRPARPDQPGEKS